MDKIAALRVRQWLPEWEDISWNEELNQGKPRPHFYVFSLSAKRLRELSGVYRRQADPAIPRSIDSGPQRYHDESRSREISEFVKYGFPWSDLNPAKRASADFESLKKPGWLPTSIVVNILEADDKRDGRTVTPDRRIDVQDLDDISYLTLPGPGKEDGIPPIEVIDGQHRLWAFSDDKVDDTFELPVVAFVGLDRSWQAYLFWIINIKPKKINASLAFDLYPLLRGEDWLEKFFGHSIYRETRAQELVESLWSHVDSPWNGKINMLGERGPDKGTISQAAWVRSLTATFLRPWNLEDSKLGGFFGAPKGTDRLTLDWSRPLQAALLILVWQKVAAALGNSDESIDPMFAKERGLLSADQGVRAILYVFNDILVIATQKLDLTSLSSDVFTEPVDSSSVSASLEALAKDEPLSNVIGAIAVAVATFDWRPYNIIDDDENEHKVRKAGYRGSGGYKLLREDLTRHLIQEVDDPYRELCVSVANRIGVL